MKKLTFGLLGALAAATTVVLVRQYKQIEEPDRVAVVPDGETPAATISLDRMRELGL